MSITMPKITFNFKQKAINFIERSARGIAILVIKDDTNNTFNVKTYQNAYALQADSALYTSDNYSYINDVLTFAANKVIVVRVATTDSVTNALAIVEKNATTGWVTTVSSTAADYTTLVNWIKAKETAGFTFKAVVYNASTAPDCKHVVNFVNSNVVFNDSRADETGEKYLPSLIGILAACNTQTGSTYFKCTNLVSCTAVADNDTALNVGKFILLNDTDGVKVGLGINSLTTFNTTNPEDMRYIDNVEAIDQIVDDVREEFKTNYIGKKNTLDEQMNFIAEVNVYFRDLAKSEILDPNYNNYCDVDIEAQRTAWTAIKPEASNWDDATVRRTSYKRSVYLAGNVKIVGSMENLVFNIAIL